MTRYYRVEINGDAQNCARIINDLRSETWNLCVDQQGYLIVAESEWNGLEQLAAKHDCELITVSQIQQAA